MATPASMQRREAANLSVSAESFAVDAVIEPDPREATHFSEGSWSEAAGGWLGYVELGLRWSFFNI